VLPVRPRRHRSTRRRQDAASLPRRPVSARTVGKTYTAPDGKTFRPSLSPLADPGPASGQVARHQPGGGLRFASAGDLPTKRLGRRVYVVSAKLREFIETEEKAA
jgi:hypothetical protein